jgi:GT2 family glycosyltransferase
MPTKRTGHTGTPRRPGERYPIELLLHEVHRDLDKQIRAEAKAKGTTSYAVVQRRFPDAYRRFIARRDAINGKINGCNMTMRRALLDRLGLFDEDFGPGSRVGSGEDTEYMFRAYTAGASIHYVPDMTVFHHHGRKTRNDGFTLWRRYMMGNGAHLMKYLLRNPDLCRPFYWDIKNAVREIITGSNTFLPDVGFSHRHKVLYTMRGALRYLLMRKDGPPSGYCPIDASLSDREGIASFEKSVGRVPFGTAD